MMPVRRTVPCLARVVFPLGLVLSCLVQSPSLRADTVYTYTGQPYTYCQGTYCANPAAALSITLHIQPGVQLANLSAGPIVDGVPSPPFGNLTQYVSAVSITDGTGLSISSLNGLYVDVATDNNGNITGWTIFDSAVSDTGQVNAKVISSFSPCHSGGGATPAQGACDFSETGPLGAVVGYGENYHQAGTWTQSVEPTVQFLGGGISSLFQQLGRAAVSLGGGPGTACIWTQNANSNILARDNRTTAPTDEPGNTWVVWTPGTGTCSAPAGDFNVYSYMTLESLAANRCYFEVDSSGVPGCLQVLTVGPNTAGANLLPVNDTAGGIPLSVINALNGRHFFVAGTDIRPEDAVFALQRAFAPCNKLILRQYFNDVSYHLYGLGYQSASNPNVGVAIQGNVSYGGGTSNIVNFNITGLDPITNAGVPAYSVTTIGAQPMLVAAAPTSDGAVQQMTDIATYTLSQFYAGNLGRSTDLYGVTSPEPINFLVPSPMAGDWNVFEYSVPQTTQFHTGQETANCSAGSVLQNPMDLPTIPGVFGGAANRIRVIGTGSMTASLLAACPGIARLGYFFWNVATVQGLTNVKYLKVNGVDPLYDQTQSTYQYTGILPGSGATGDPGLSGVNFAMVNAADYPIWSPLRLIGPTGINNFLTPTISNAGVEAMVGALNSLASTQKDYIPVNNMNIWHSHFQIVGQPGAANGPGVGATTLCNGGVSESGGDAGGSTMLIINNANFCQDVGSTTGKLNLTQ